MPKTYSLEFEIKIKKAYKKGMLTNDIAKKYKCTPHYINKVRKKYELKRMNTDQTNIINKFKILKKVSFVSSSNRKEYKYILNCTCCGNENEVVISQLNRLLKAKKDYMCDKCSLSFDTRTERASKQALRKDNTTGFIGVCINQYKDKIYGYVSTLMSKGECIYKNKYRDEFLHEKTLIQAAVDRDLFIIEHNLPHTRNFKNLELLANMEYLAYDDIETLKNKLETHNKIT